MPQYLKIAEKIYQNVKEKKGFTDDPMEDLNNLMIELRQEIKGTKLKLLYNYIDFAEILIKPLQESKIKLDLSLIPKSKNTQEANSNMRCDSFKSHMIINKLSKFL